MGELIVMPLRNTEKQATKNTSPAVAGDSLRKQSVGSDAAITDFSIWSKAPRERTAGYFPTYSAVSKAMQTAMRGWIREWFAANVEILQKPHAAYALLVYQCTHPFYGRPTNIFTYEIQQTDTLHKAFRSAANKLGPLPEIARYQAPRLVHPGTLLRLSQQRSRQLRLKEPADRVPYVPCGDHAHGRDPALQHYRPPHYWHGGIARPSAPYLPHSAAPFFGPVRP
jgi:hypothetical protein